MCCDVGDVYDVVVLILLLLFDRDTCCARLSLAHRFIYVIRFVIFILISTVQWIIIGLTDDDAVDELKRMYANEEDDDSAIKNAGVYLLTSIGLTIITFMYAGVFIYHAVKNPRSNGLFKLFVMSQFNMLVIDIWMLVFTILLGNQNGTQLVDYSSFSDGFRSTVFFISILDILHSLIGFVGIFMNKDKIYSEIYG